jgi:hypothetical protein
VFIYHVFSSIDNACLRDLALFSKQSLLRQTDTVPTDEDEEGIYSSTESRNTTGLIFYTLATALVVTKGRGGNSSSSSAAMLEVTP